MSESRVARVALLLLMLALVVVAHSLILMYLQAPLIGLLAIWILALVWLITRSKKVVPRIIAVNLIAIVVVLAGAEAFFWIKHRRSDSENFSQINSHNYQIAHDILGYAPYPETSKQVSKSYRGELLYETTYTIDDVGLRVSPPERENGVDGTVLFFGGSFTYGEGVADSETLPYQVGVLSDGRFRVRNLGFHGYGPQQMLAALESGLVLPLSDPELPTTAVYQCGLFHARRAAGSVPWCSRLPKYELGSNGVVRAAGFYQDFQPQRRMIARFAARSFLYTSLFGEDRSANGQEIDLMVAIIGSARDQLQRLLPGSEMHVIYWDEGNFWRDRAVVNGLKALEIQTHRVSSVFSVNDPAFRISPFDQHPNALANRALAEFVVTTILPEEDVAEGGVSPPS